jgi:hypothetical protein
MPIGPGREPGLGSLNQQLEEEEFGEKNFDVQSIAVFLPGPGVENRAVCNFLPTPGGSQHF